MSDAPDNAFLPDLAELTDVRELATGIKLFRCRPLESGVRFHYVPGQFGFLSAIGVGEAPFGMAVSESRGGGQLEFAVQRIGTVTDALHEMQKGEIVAVRGPMGRGFPLDELRGRRVVILGGGIGLAPLRPLVQEILDHRDDYGEMTIFCAGRSPDLLVFREEYEEWKAAPRTLVHVTVDKGDDVLDRPRRPHHPGARRDRPFARGSRGRHLRPADHDQVRAEGARALGLRPRAGDHDARGQDEVRHRQVRPVQRGRPVHLHRRPGLPLRRDPAVPRGVLGSCYVLTARHVIEWTAPISSSRVTPQPASMESASSGATFASDAR